MIRFLSCKTFAGGPEKVKNRVYSCVFPHCLLNDTNDILSRNASLQNQAEQPLRLLSVV